MNTTILTVTSCEDNHCNEVVATTGATTVSAIDNNELTSHAEATKDGVSTTAPMTTHCTNDVCLEEVITADISIATGTFNSVESTYTTYAPFDSGGSHTTETALAVITSVVKSCRDESSTEMVITRTTTQVVTLSVASRGLSTAET
ncbi:uncharacterized protein CYBJADRAFT_161895 [Cyberlindnera jadinii NRRL Y-1542]|uniref:Uncharacterized protein n=1 Tax=Cyberlindnera jadinii (strain ATCC 18201 / CBS 1600 / BCRC 20928 / JCM 3617 / NBRC 0987 / NRRL Y-1542) TaxID=983966 RepID=A0A1E4S4U7_CYBJN|nr:hypothetical protein CYBJADRAFT_161895 [Cyberlindnera jadinii NRRL Y-1542]ODV74480.1 hypothetical protein CYBJADRAFT_161895 [Cyberlindnera jadinii NRRL Y-1542]